MLGPWYEGLQLPMAEHSQPVQPYHILQSVPENIIMFFFSIIDDIQLQKNAMWTDKQLKETIGRENMGLKLEYRYTM